MPNLADGLSDQRRLIPQSSPSLISGYVAPAGKRNPTLAAEALANEWVGTGLSAFTHAACCRCKNLSSDGADITSRLIPPCRLLGLPLRLGLVLLILILTALLMLLPALLLVALPIALFISHWTLLAFIHIEKSPLI